MSWLEKGMTAGRRHWLPLLSFAILAVTCTDTNYSDGRDVAVVLSGLIYKSYIVFSLAALLILAWRHRSKAAAWRAVQFTVLTFLMTNVMKLIIHLPRPPHIHHGVKVLHDSYSAGFPSAHTALAFGLAWMIFEDDWALSIIWFAVAIAIGWSRIELYAHYPYQVLWGAILGSLTAWGVNYYPRYAAAASRLSLHPAPVAKPNLP